MLVWEAHRDFASVLGDTCNISSTAIYDGSRYPRTARNSYLYRAILDILRQVLQSVQILPKSTVALIFKNMFPTQIKTIRINMSDFIQDPIESYKTAGFSYTIDLANWLQNNGSGNKNKPLVVLDVIAHELQVNGTMGPVPLPIKVNARGKLINSRITEKADSFCEYVSNNLIIYDNYRTLVDNYFASIHYLPYPRNPADAVIPTDPKSEYEYIDQLDIEEAFIPKMFSLATLYAMTDDQSADNQGLIAAQLQQYQMNVSQGG